jgi:hypothetical protein
MLARASMGCLGINLSRKAKKAEGLEQHKKLQREKDQKRKREQRQELSPIGALKPVFIWRKSYRRTD